MLHGVGGRNPWLLLGGGGALVVVVVALARRSSSANSQGATTAANPTGTYDSSLNDFEGYFQDQLSNLQQQIANQPAPTSAPLPVSQGPNPPAKAGAPTPVFAPAPAPRPAASRTQDIVRVQSGNTLSGIAAKFGETWQQVWAYNLQPGVRSAADEATLRKRGANLIVPGEQIYIPKK